MERNRRVGLEVRPPLVVEKNHPRKREGESGATASFLPSKYLGAQCNDGQPNRPSDPEGHSLFSAFSGLKTGTSSLVRRQFTEKELVDLTLAIVTINGWNRLSVAFRKVPGTYQPAKR